jgi:hypothetical protein
MSFNFLGVRCLDLVGGPRDAREPQGGQAQETVQYRLRKLRPGGREHSGEAHTGDPVGEPPSPLPYHSRWPFPALYFYTLSETSFT